MSTKHYIVRYFQNGDSQFIKVVSNELDAQEWCQREDTHGEGWFDGYTDQKPSCHPDNS